MNTAEPKQEWRGVGLGNGYEVSDLGNVRSKVRSRVGFRRLVPDVTDRGYRYVNVRGKRIKVSVLVLEAFVGPRPEGMQVCHGPKGVSDDSLFNLSWGTAHKNNTDDKRRDGTTQEGEKNPFSKLTEEEVRYIKSNYRKRSIRYGANGMARQIGVSPTTILRVLSGETWSHVK